MRMPPSTAWAKLAGAGRPPSPRAGVKSAATDQSPSPVSSRGRVALGDALEAGRQLGQTLAGLAAWPTTGEM